MLEKDFLEYAMLQTETYCKEFDWSSVVVAGGHKYDAGDPKTFPQPIAIDPTDCQIVRKLHHHCKSEKDKLAMQDGEKASRFKTWDRYLLLWKLFL